ncbi:MAG: 2-oxoglutarate dehydrogenase complex dihydrolipoyllysine-residue succinyltransferase [Alphaproteobacteria bacterium]|nr:2-oxoglutarate dehydrogenase complex dihydrolipoyllysine-residue succinyltransferase [Alphaproteobacteria bacterium]
MSVDVTIPQIGESISTVFISKWLKKPGDVVAEGDPVLELDSDKASMEVPAPGAGRIAELLVGEGDEVPIGAVVARIEAGDAPAASSDAPADASDKADKAKAADAAADDKAADEAPARASGDVKAGPAARVAAAEKGVALDGVQGSGKGGRVTSADVAKAAASGGVSQGTKDAKGSTPATKAPAASPEGRTTRQKMSPLRRTIARRLVEAQQTAAMLTTFNEVDMSGIMALRKQYQDRFVERYGIKVGFMSFFVKAVVDALKAYPAVNAEIDGDELVYKHFYNIGVAVSGPKGLVVPVVRDADQLSFAQTEQAIADLAKKARDNKLSMDDFADGTFTVSNGGIFGSMMSTPILNPPQVGILGMHNIVDRAVVIDGQVVVRPMMYLALSYDHRIIDGREAVSFLVRVKECVEHPERMLLEV